MKTAWQAAFQNLRLDATAFYHNVVRLSSKIDFRVFVLFPLDTGAKWGYTTYILATFYCGAKLCRFRQKAPQNLRHCGSPRRNGELSEWSKVQHSKSCYKCLKVNKYAVEGYRSGHNGADSKSVWEQSHAGSNPAPSAIYPPHKGEWVSKQEFLITGIPVLLLEDHRLIKDGKRADPYLIFGFWLDLAPHC